ncbi:MAG: hypothetical protein LBC80_08420 [Treponema sp.]|jgi:hypothetical protein|nr:hypothetical protein [Treponema sp.]
MKNFRKTILVCMVILFFSASPVFSQNSLDSLRENVDKFTDSVAQAMPFYSTMGLNWSDAYIGQIIDLPPNFGIGISAGATTMNFASVNDLMRMFRVELPISGGISSLGLPLPGYTVEGRIGGIVLPFDIGVKFSYIQPDAFGSVVGLMARRPNFEMKHTLIGADIRYALLHYKVLPVRLSVGAGFNYLDGGITATVSAPLAFSFTDSNDHYYTLNSTESQLGVEWKTKTLEFKTQFSFPLKIITPYAGVGVSYAWSQAGYRVKTSQLTVSGGELSDFEKYLLDEFKLSSVSETGFETIKKFTSFNSRVFGGFSFNFAVVRLDLTTMYDLVGNNLGATLGLRFQL